MSPKLSSDGDDLDPKLGKLDNPTPTPSVGRNAATLNSNNPTPNPLVSRDAVTLNSNTTSKSALPDETLTSSKRKQSAWTPADSQALAAKHGMPSMEFATMGFFTQSAPKAAEVPFKAVEKERAVDTPALTEKKKEKLNDMVSETANEAIFNPEDMTWAMRTWQVVEQEEPEESEDEEIVDLGDW